MEDTQRLQLEVDQPFIVSIRGDRALNTGVQRSRVLGERRKRCRDSGAIGECNS